MDEWHRFYLGQSTANCEEFERISMSNIRIMLLVKKIRFLEGSCYFLPRIDKCVINCVDCQKYKSRKNDSFSIDDIFYDLNA